MFRISIILLFISGILVNVHAQSSPTGDTLLNLITHGKDPKNQNEIIAVYDRYVTSNMKLSLNTLDSVGKIAFNNAFLSGQGVTYLLIGRIHYSYSEFFKSADAYKKALAIFEKSNNIQGILNSKLLIANTYFEIANFNDGFKLLTECLKISDSVKNEFFKSKVLNNIGLMYLQRNDNKNALEYLYKSLKIKLKYNNKASIANTYNNIGELYLNENNLDQASDFLHKALNIRQELNDISGLSETQNNFAHLYELSNEDELAISYYKQSLANSEAINNKLGIAKNCGELGRLYTELDSLDKAEALFKKSLKIVTAENLPIAIILICKAYANLAVKQNNYVKAYELLNQSILYSDSVNLKQPGVNLDFLSNNNSKLLQQIATLNHNSSKNSTIIWALIILIACILIMGGYYIIQLKRKQIINYQKLSADIDKLNHEKADFKSILTAEVERQTLTLQSEIDERHKVDIELKKALKRAEDANYLKNAFLSNISHEIRTPLNGIIGFASLLESELSLTENQELYEYANGISQSGERLLHLLTNLIDISRIEANDLEINLVECDLAGILQDAGELFKFKANEKGIRFNLQKNQIPPALADQNNLMRVLSDLIDNALKYTEKGFINISCGISENSSDLFIRVKDTGIGIDPTYIPYLFEAFRQESLGFSRAYQGAGLGLPLAKRLIELMKGRIEVVSEKGLGTTVTIYLKQSGSSVLRIENTEKAITSSLEYAERPISILIIEDDRMNRMVLKKMLENVGELGLAVDGDNTLEIIEREFAKKHIFDIMLVDINLPTPWDGIMLMHKIKQDYKDYEKIPFIAQTAYAMSGDRERFLEAGFDDYISKPISKNHLLSIIQKHINH